MVAFLIGAVLIGFMIGVVISYALWAVVQNIEKRI